MLLGELISVTEKVTETSPLPNAKISQPTAKKYFQLLNQVKTMSLLPQVEIPELEGKFLPIKTENLWSIQAHFNLNSVRILKVMKFLNLSKADSFVNDLMNFCT